MSIEITDVISQAETEVFEIPASKFLQEHYFGGGSEMENVFDTKSVLIDMDNGNRESGAFLKKGYADGNTTTFFSATVIPPRIAVSDGIDTVGNDKDRMMFEKLCKGVGAAQLSRADAFNALLKLKLARCGEKVLRSIERLCAAVITGNGLSFSYNTSPTDSTAVNCEVSYWDLGSDASNPNANPQTYANAVKWGGTNATPYDDICAMISKLRQNGGEADELLLSDSAWSKLHADIIAKQLNEGQIQFINLTNNGAQTLEQPYEGATVVGDVLFNGTRLRCIVYAGGYQASDGTFTPYLSGDFAAVIKSGCGRILYGAVSKVNPAAVASYDVPAVSALTGKLIGTRHVDANTDDVSVRVESVPLPMPSHIWSWVVLQQHA